MTLLKVSKFQNEFMKSSFLPKYEPKIVRISACSMARAGQKSLQYFGRNNDFINIHSEIYWPLLYCIFNSSHYSKDKSSRGRLSSPTISDSFYSLMDQDLIVKWWEEIWQRSSHDNTFLSEFDPSPYSYEDTSFIGT